MTSRPFNLALIFFVSTTLAVPAPAAETLTELLSRMDKSAGVFSTLTASLRQLQHTEILKTNDVETAQVKLKRTKGGLVGRVDFNEPNRRTVALHERTVEQFFPKSNTVQVTDVGKLGRQLDQFLLLGFGTSGKDLQRDYNVRLIGPEAVGDKETTHIEIVPKSKEALEYFKKAQLWIASGAAYPVQEKIYTNEQDYWLINYTEVKLNVPLTDQELELRLPAGAKRIK